MGYLDFFKEVSDKDLKHLMTDNYPLLIFLCNGLAVELEIIKQEVSRTHYKN